MNERAVHTLIIQARLRFLNGKHLAVLIRGARKVVFQIPAQGPNYPAMAVRLLNAVPEDAIAFSLLSPFSESLSDPTSSSPVEPRPDPDHPGSKIRQVIAVWDTRLLFLYMNLWVCSLDLSLHELSAKAVKRHFLVLSE